MINGTAPGKYNVTEILTSPLTDTLSHGRHEGSSCYQRHILMNVEVVEVRFEELGRKARWTWP